uniref:DNA methyltransferase n=1 Tax=Megamonas funiformis TaxID=437897 RepID=UPI00241DA334
GEDTAKKLLEDGYLELANKNGKYNIYRIFPDNISYIPFGSLILDEVGTTAKGARILKDLNMTNVFSFSKPIELIDYFINLLIEKDSIILDFFSGSATTAHAVMQLNAEDGGKRKFIMVQLPEKTDEKSEAFKAGYKNICEIGKERIRRAGEKIKEEAGLNGQDLDIGFRVLKLDSSNMKDIYYSADEYDQGMLENMQSNTKEDRTDLDLLFGCLVDWGLELDKPYTTKVINGHKVHIYNDGDLVACFEKDLDMKTIDEIAKLQALRVVFSDNSFVDSAIKINVAEHFKMIAPDTDIKII